MEMRECVSLPWMGAGGSLALRKARCSMAVGDDGTANGTRNEVRKRARKGAGLTPREREALQILCAGKRPREIARKMVIEEDTARKHIKAICRKLGAHGATELIVIAARLGLLDGN